MILKASPETAIDALVLAEIFHDAGFPEGVVSIVPAGRETSDYLVSHPGVDKIAFTGSTAAGRRIAAIAGEQLKRVSLELGGKSAAIILEDADVEAAVGGLSTPPSPNNGESCVAHTRILAPRSRYEEIVAAMKTMVESLTVGDPDDPDTFVGPMVRTDQQERIRGYIESAVAEGARLVTGGAEPIEGLTGNYIRPTLFADVDNSMRIAQEEIFGPVLVVIPFDNEEEAIRIANDSEYGLSGGVWTADKEHGLEVLRQVRSGWMNVNGAPPPSPARSAATRRAAPAASSAHWVSTATPRPRPSPSDGSPGPGPAAPPGRSAGSRGSGARVERRSLTWRAGAPLLLRCHTGTRRPGGTGRGCGMGPGRRSTPGQNDGPMDMHPLRLTPHGLLFREPRAAGPGLAGAPPHRMRFAHRFRSSLLQILVRGVAGRRCGVGSVRSAVRERSGAEVPARGQAGGPSDAPMDVKRWSQRHRASRLAVIVWWISRAM